jgi:hypothetical protein
MVDRAAVQHRRALIKPLGAVRIAKAFLPERA